MNASNVAHERTKPVALRTNRARVLVAAPVAPPPTPNVAIGASLPFVPRAAGHSLTYCRPGPYRAYAIRWAYAIRPYSARPMAPTDLHMAGSVCVNRSAI